MTEVAALGLKVTSDSVPLATDRLEEFAVAATKADVANDKLSTSSKNVATTSNAASGAMQKAAQSAKGVHGATERAARGAKAANDNTARMGSAFVNAGFQIQDFAVQVASGQSALVAFTQQFPQLAGAFGFSGTLAMWGAGIGTLSAVLLAVIPKFLDLQSSADKTKDALDRLKEAQDALTNSLQIANAPLSELQEKYGANAAMVRELAVAQTQLNLAVARGALKDAVADIRDVTDAYANVGISLSSTAEAYRNIYRDFGLTGAAANELRQRLQELNNATTLDEQATRLDGLMTFLNGVGVAADKLPPTFAQALSSLTGMRINAAQLESLMNGTAGPSEVIRQETERQAAAAAGMIASYQQQAAISMTIATYGKDSAQVEALKRQEAMATVDAYIKQNDLSGKVADDLRNAALQAFDAANATDAWAAAMSGVKAQLDAIAGVLSAIGGGVMDRVSIAAQNKALDAGLTASEARKAGLRAQEDLRLLGQRAQLQNQFGNTVGGFMGDALQAELSDRRSQEDALEKRYASVAEAAKASRKAMSDAAKGARSAANDAQKLADAYNGMTSSARQFIEQQKLEAQTLGMTEEAANRLRYEQDLLNQAANDNINLTAAQKQEIAGLAQQMAATEANTKRLKEAFDFAKDATKGFITDLRTGLMNGEGFFKSFANAATNLLNKVISKIEDELVNALFSIGGASSGGGGLFGGILGGIGKLFGFANGGAFSGGVHAFAKGGTFTNQVVSQPTMFRFAKGTGLMGEAGPEAIMPLGRDASGRLGVYARGNHGGSDVQYVQVPYIVSVEADDSGKIKAMMKQVSGETVQQAAPSIVKAANQSAPTAVAQFQQTKQGGDYRT